jgi:hypothetical protein
MVLVSRLGPRVAAQMLVACADDLSPTIQLWDLCGTTSY